jgi:RNA polymerase sigma-70 factor, ECF subfamily
LALEMVARLSYGRLVAILAARTGHLADAEDALGDALIRALQLWPRTGVPDHPDAWLLTAARRRWTDAKRSTQVAQRAWAHIKLLAQERSAQPGHGFGDERLKLMFVCAHPAVDADVRAPLMLNTVLGLDARRAASAFLVPPGTMGQRLTRAKAKIATARVPFQVPSSEAMEDRLADVLAAIYAAYSVGYDGIPVGDQKAAGLAQEAMWLATLVCELLPAAAEAHGLRSIMLFAEARRPARGGPSGFVPLEMQDTSLWDATLLAQAEAALRLASQHLTLKRYQLEAAIQAAHSARRHGGGTNWAEILLLYQGLVSVCPTTGALTGCAVALAEVEGPKAGLAALIRINPVLRQTYQPWWAARAHLATMAGQREMALEAYDRAIGLTEDAAIRLYLFDKKRLCLAGRM